MGQALPRRLRTSELNDYDSSRHPCVREHRARPGSAQVAHTTEALGASWVGGSGRHSHAQHFRWALEARR